ncbi:hypothetical protein HK103_007096 [Boothiomyces macroporosus]|uniref:Uncharacterized protein n=1 Tax=Boothiomyces macroporosus TaxID=261099 RepID=A0AAD5Y243_9FUNG|nr:hypothetical protein HK103_007096 [Boothiomyces macroporosus]
MQFLKSNYPKGLYFYPTGNKFLVSFVKPQSFKPSQITIGTAENESLKDFKENSKFSKLLYSTIKENLDQCEYTKALALNQKSGYLNINDLRVGAIFGRVNDPEDIFGSVLIKDGKIDKSTFEIMPTHRLTIYTEN